MDTVTFLTGVLFLATINSVTGQRTIHVYEGEFATLPCSGTQTSYAWYISSSLAPSNRVVSWVPNPSPGRYEFYRHLAGGRAFINPVSGDLTIRNVALTPTTDEHTYICSGSTVGVVKLDIRVKATDISITGLDSVIMAGTNITATCTVPRVRPANEDMISWQIVEVRDLGSGQVTMTENEDSTFKVTSVLEMNFDKGDAYPVVECRVQIPGTTDVETSRKTVAVQWTSDTKVKQEDPSVPPSPGLEKSFLCDYNLPHPPTVMSVRWTRDGRDITAGGRFTGVDTIKLTIRELEWGDRGEYRCYVTSPAGEGNAISSYNLRVSYEDCPCSWGAYGNHCYYYMGSVKTKAAAEEDCISYGGHLASIHSKLENDHILSLSTSPSLFWFGADIQGSTWTWIDGSDTIWSNWESPVVDGDQCASISPWTSLGLWTTSQDCTLTLQPYVCKVDKYTTDRCNEEHCLFLICRVPSEAKELCSSLDMQLVSPNRTTEELNAIFSSLDAPLGEYILSDEGDNGCVTAHWNKNFVTVESKSPQQCDSWYFLCEKLPDPTTEPPPTTTGRGTVTISLAEVEVARTFMVVRWYVNESFRMKRETEPFNVVIQYKLTTESRYTRYPRQGGVDVDQEYAVILGSFLDNAAYNVKVTLYKGDLEVAGSSQEKIVTEDGSQLDATSTALSPAILAALAVLAGLLLITIILLIVVYARFVAPRNKKGSEPKPDKDSHIDGPPMTPNQHLGLDNHGYARQDSEEWQRPNAFFKGSQNGVAMTAASGASPSLPAPTEVGFYNEKSHLTNRAAHFNQVMPHASSFPEMGTPLRRFTPLENLSRKNETSLNGPPHESNLAVLGCSRRILDQSPVDRSVDLTADEREAARGTPILELAERQYDNAGEDNHGFTSHEDYEEVDDMENNNQVSHYEAPPDLPPSFPDPDDSSRSSMGSETGPGYTEVSKPTPAPRLRPRATVAPFNEDPEHVDDHGTVNPAYVRHDSDDFDMDPTYKSWDGTHATEIANEDDRSSSPVVKPESYESVPPYVEPPPNDYTPMQRSPTEGTPMQLYPTDGPTRHLYPTYDTTLHMYPQEGPELQITPPEGTSIQMSPSQSLGRATEV